MFLIKTTTIDLLVFFIMTLFFSSSFQKKHKKDFEYLYSIPYHNNKISNKA